MRLSSSEKIFRNVITKRYAERISRKDKHKITRPAALRKSATNGKARIYRV